MESPRWALVECASIREQWEQEMRRQCILCTKIIKLTHNGTYIVNSTYFD
jgi:hypothetical protein